MSLLGFFTWKEYEYKEKDHALGFLMLDDLTDKNVCDILQLFDQLYGDTNQETTEYALEFQLLTRMLVCRHAIVVNPLYLALDECISEFKPFMSKRSYNRFVSASQSFSKELEQKNEKTLVRITELDVNGCGDSASVLLWIDMPKNETDREQVLSQLKNKLNVIKQRAWEQDECLDTDEMIQMALDAFGISADDASCFEIEF